MIKTIISQKSFCDEMVKVAVNWHGKHYNIGGKTNREIRKMGRMQRKKDSGGLLVGRRTREKARQRNLQFIASRKR